MSAPRFVDVPASAIEAELEAIGQKVGVRAWTTSWGKRGNERTFELVAPAQRHGCALVRVYTTLSVGADAVRACGEDAVRIVVLEALGERVGGNERPIAESRKLLRTAPTQLPEEQRVRAFLDRLRAALREAYEVARDHEVWAPAGSVHAGVPGSMLALSPTTVRLLFEPKHLVSGSGRYLTKLATPEGALLVSFTKQKIENGLDEVFEVTGRVLRHETNARGECETVVALFGGKS